MRGFVPDYEMKTLPSLRETLEALAARPGFWSVFAGGTDLMVQFEAGRLQHKNYLNIGDHPELKGISAGANELRIGSMTTYSEIQESEIIQREFPLLARSAWVTGAKAIQNRGTLGGNIANASPAADSPPSLLAYGAELEILSAQGRRQIPYEEFHLGYKKTALAGGEIISAILLPRGRRWTHHYYRKVGTRAFQSISKIAFSAAALVQDGQIVELRIGLASVGAMPLRARVLEDQLRGQKLSGIPHDKAIGMFEQSLTPIDDIRSTEVYRRKIAGRVAKEFLHFLGEKPGAYFF